MEPRLHLTKHSTEGLNALYATEKYLSKCDLDHTLMHLVKMRASQIYGCAYCLNMHSKDARALGETEQRLYALNAWHETPFFNERERAALAWTETLTLVSQTHVPDSAYEEARKQFSEKELVDLTYLVASINSWNRLAISLRAVPGTYKPAAASTAKSS
jgi:AhpD family alkylhydroperoxidase